MAKSQQQTRVLANRHQGAIEQSNVIDDSLLPSAEELAKLKEINPEIIQWIMSRSEKEQDARLEFNKDRMKLAHKETNITTISLWLAFILMIASLALSALFIYFGKSLAGTIFGGISLLLIVQAFLKFGRK